MLKLARQPYYRWRKTPVTDADLAEAYRANALFDAHRDDPEFGYRYLLDEARDAGQVMAERTAWRICSTNGWWSVFGKPKRGKAGRPGPPVHDDLLAVSDAKGRVRHEFTATGPNEVWLSDITEHWTGEGKLYLCAVKDVYSNRIVGYSIDSRMKSRLAVAALDNAVARPWAASRPSSTRPSRPHQPYWLPNPTCHLIVQQSRQTVVPIVNSAQTFRRAKCETVARRS
ncbi:DDE-type integrase/transposase/recombinase [Mumia zhuanghuii]|uniref:DDE-type integrase/transposase/recombinase n=1 Tax=Mumia zhuanghuii TaxID=2585211 RepID=A0A5Q6S4T7_9ACTN|nr:DDE-type integrase/transposase/recombinase [Mumia zhuanghuii]